ncbi:MAG: outer membrane receptor for ferrienterochelin and, partial [Chitinophagaceae bacterium]
VSILDGEGIIILGNNEDAQETSTKQNNWNLRNKINYHRGRKMFNAGVELEWNKINNQFLQNKFGSYFYYSIADFLNKKTPGAYEINIPSGFAASSVDNFKTAFFINSEWRIGKNFTIHAGMRMSFQQLLGNLQTDSLTTEKVLPTIASYYPTVNFIYGKNPIIKPNFSPRLSCSFQLPKNKMNIEIGTGLFNGRMPLAWMGGMYSNNGLNYTYFEANDQELKRIRFEQTTNKQWQPQQFGRAGNKGVLNLSTPNISMPSVWRSSVELSKWIMQKWLVQLESMYYYNINEIAFSNINILPPTDTLQGPDQRPIYSAFNKARIPILNDSSNPYEQIILMGNNVSQHGFGYRFGLKVKREITHAHFSVQYSFGESYSVFDGNFSVLLNQWKLNEQVYGRNNVHISRADYSPGHLIQCWAKKDWIVGKNKRKASISIAYIGQSGNGFSYVYGGKNLSRDEPSTTGYDLLYVPTTKELGEQVFIPLETNNTYYTADQQKEALEWFIEADPYLKKIRGRYAERNGSRVPFNHQIDLKILMITSFKIGLRKYGMQFSLDFINLGNLIHSQWGQNWSIPGNRFKLINFEGFLSPTQYIPQFSFDPLMVEHQKKGIFQINKANYRQEWQIQLGMRINFY